MVRSNAIENIFEPSGIPGVMKMIISSYDGHSEYLFNEKFSAEIQEEKWYTKRRSSRFLQKVIDVPVTKLISVYNIAKFFPKQESYNGGQIYFPRYLCQLHLPGVRFKSTNIRKCSFKLGMKYWKPGDYRDEFLQVSLNDDPAVQWYSIGAAKDHLAFIEKRNRRRALPGYSGVVADALDAEENPSAKIALEEQEEKAFQLREELKDQEAKAARIRDWNKE